MSNKPLSNSLSVDSKKRLLFKYLDVNGAASMLTYSDIQFTNATKLNDPFDCHPGLIDFSKITPTDCKGWSPEDAILLESDPYRRNREEAWICCLSKVFDSLLMWSYYSQHKGVCIGLDIEKVEEYLNRSMPGLMVSSSFEVKYRNIIEKPDYFTDAEDFFHYQISTKAKEWAHEQEVRVFIMKPSPWFMKLNEPPKDETEVTDWKEVRAYPPIGGECFASIYLGANIEEKKKAGIIKIARKLNPDIHIYQMTVNPDAFKLDFCEVYCYITT